MAKGKRAVALFEVIRKDARFDRKTPEVLKESPADFSQKMVAQAVDLWRKKHSDPETWTAAPVKVRQSFSAQFAGFTAGWRAGMARSAKIAEAARAWIIRQDSIIFGAAAALIIISALLLVRRLYHPTAALASPIEEVLRNGSAHPSVLAVHSEAQSSPESQPLSPEMLADVQQAGDKTTATPETSNLAKPGARIVNMHYVLMQSYFEEKTAKDARDFLVENGIPCTIERGIKGWRSDFYQVIGLQGFPRTSGPAYTAYRSKIEELGPKFSPKSHYKRFVPQAIKW
jgi:hypothetical protein